MNTNTLLAIVVCAVTAGTIIESYISAHHPDATNTAQVKCATADVAVSPLGNNLYAVTCRAR